MPRFWMVYLEGRNTPAHKHQHKTAAVAEAGRLYEKEKRRAYVLEVVGFHDSVGSAYREQAAAAPEAPEQAGRPIPPLLQLSDAERKLCKAHETFIRAMAEVRARTGCSYREAKETCEFYRDWYRQ